MAQPRFGISPWMASLPVRGRGFLVRLGIDYLVKHRNGHERLIPQRVTAFALLYVPVSCERGPGIADFDPPASEASRQSRSRRSGLHSN